MRGVALMLKKRGERWVFHVELRVICLEIAVDGATTSDDKMRPIVCCSSYLISTLFSSKKMLKL
jgi:hypothetical protein